MSDLNAKNSTSLRRSITYRYVIALGFIAILSTTAFLLLQKVLNNSEHTAYIVNISGKQRMLSQHIALDIYQIHYANVEKTDKNILNTLATMLQSHTNEMQKANDILSSGNLPNGKTISPSKEIQEIYFGEKNLKARVDEYIKIANSMLFAVEHDAIDTIITQISKRSEPLLVDLNKAVVQYQLEGEERLKNLHIMESIAWGVTMLLLFIEALFIFKPLTKDIVKLHKKNKHILSNLENIIDIKTQRLEQSNKKLQEIAMIDPLTGLKNRLTLEEELQELINGYKKKHVSICNTLFRY